MKNEKHEFYGFRELKTSYQINRMILKVAKEIEGGPHLRDPSENSAKPLLLVDMHINLKH